MVWSQVEPHGEAWCSCWVASIHMLLRAAVLLCVLLRAALLTCTWKGASAWVQMGGASQGAGRQVLVLPA